MLRLALAAWLVVLSASLPAVAKDTMAVEFDAVADKPMLTLSREHGMVRGVAQTPLVRVYGDGRVHVHLPAYMIGAGHYQYTLSAKELEGLVGQLAAAGLMSFDTGAVRAARDAAATAQRTATGERFVTLDSTRTRIGLQFAHFAGAGKAGGALERTIEWADAAIDAERHPGVSALAGLAAAERTLLSLTTHPQRRAVKAPAGE